MSCLLLLREEKDNLIDQNKRFPSFSKVVTCPLITFSYDFSWNLKKIALLKETPWLFFTSQHGVIGFFSSLRAYLAKEEREKILKNKKYAVIGKKTAKCLETYGYKADFIPQKATKEQLIKEWEHDFSGSKIWLVGDLVKETADPLNTYWTVYKNQLPKDSLEKLEKTLTSEITHCFISSPSIWGRFYTVYKKNIFPLKFYCLGETTEKAMKKDLPGLSITPIK